MYFTPTRDFHDNDLRSDYVAGLTYKVRPGNEVLAKKVEGWLKDGSVRLGGAEPQQPNAARVTGAGKVD